MDMSTPTVSKDGFLGEIWSVSSTLTEEAMAIASAKCKEAGFDPNRGIVSLQESFINLASARNVLQEAIEKGKLVQLPITVQKELLSNLQTIASSLQGLSNGVDEIANLSNSIEILNTSVWKYGLHNLSDQVLGYQKKLNQLKNQEVQIAKLIAQLDTAQTAAQKAGSAAVDAELSKNAVAALQEQVKQSATGSAALLEQVKDAEAKATALFSTIQQHEKQTGELTSSIKTANNELLALDGSIRKFYGEVDAYRNKINQTNEQATTLITASEASLKKFREETTSKIASAAELLDAAAKGANQELTNKVATALSEQDKAFSKLANDTQVNVTKLQTDTETKVATALQQAGQSTSTLVSTAQEKLQGLEEHLAKRSDETIEANHTKTGKLLDELEKLKGEVREQIQQATGFALFGAFQSRQNQIARSKTFWTYAIAALVFISAGVTIWIAHEAQYYSANSFAFWVKLSLTVPLGFALTFCTVQYSRERRLEEEYAFKSSISVSLNPYRDLIHSILEKDGNVDLTRYSEFVIDSVRNVFTPPTDKIFDGEKKSGVTKKALKDTAELLGTLTKAAKP